MKIITKEMVIKEIQQKFPNEPFEIIEYSRVGNPFTIKCLTCGIEKTYSSYNNFINNGTHLCICLGRNKNQYLKRQNEQKILELIKSDLNKKFVQFGTREKTKKSTVTVLCKKCGQEYEKTYQDFLKNQKCQYCENCHNMNHQAFLLKVPKEYTPLEEYAGMDNKILFRHKCGFIRAITPHNLLAGHINCPRCAPKISKGERKIMNILEALNIKFEHEKHFDWALNGYIRYDFFVPQYNLIIEYHGEQHYKDIPFFHRKFSLAEQQERDLQKQQNAEKMGFNYLVIPYTDFHNIEIILKSWFNDYPNREQGRNVCCSKEETSRKR